MFPLVYEYQLRGTSRSHYVRNLNFIVVPIVGAREDISLLPTSKSEPPLIPPLPSEERDKAQCGVALVSLGEGQEEGTVQNENQDQYYTREDRGGGDTEETRRR